MAEITGRNLTIADIQKALTPKGEVADYVGMLEQSNELEEYLTFQECNKQDTHSVALQTSLPEVYYTMVNQGTPTSKMTLAQTVFETKTLEGRSHIHTEAVVNAKTRPGIRAQQGDGFIEQIGQRDKRTMFYGNPKTNPQEYLGLSTYYSSLLEANGQNIIDAGGTTNLASMWLLGLGDDGIFCIYPEGMAESVGLIREDLGKQLIVDPNDSTRYMEVWAESFKLRRGLCVKNWQYGVRIANIDTVAGLATTGTQAASAATNVTRLMARAMNKPPKRGRKAVRWVWTCNAVVHTSLMLLAMEKQSNVLTIEQGLNNFKISGFGYPILRMDQLLNTETRVV